MDAPGWPESAGGGYVVVVWGVLVCLILTAAVVSAYCVLRGHQRGRNVLVGVGLVLVGGLAALILYTPASATIDPSVEGGPAECPFDVVEGARLNVDHSTRMYTFWKPCETASRVRLGLVLGGYALLSGGVGLWMLRNQASTAESSDRELSRRGA